MKVSEFDFRLPPELVAQEPTVPRDQCRLMVISRTRKTWEHRIFRDLPEYLEKNDCLVVNDSRVLPARILGEKQKTGGKVEFLLLKSLGESRWEVLVRPGRRLSPGARVTFGQGLLTGTVEKRLPSGSRVVFFQHEGSFKEILSQLGQIPLPPYIKQPLEDSEDYQTVYGKEETSVAAPTAGLHFTPELLEKVQKKARVVAVTLDIGLDTFRPVTELRVEDHRVHKEHFRITKNSAATINQVRASGGRTVAVGTTVARVLETVATGKAQGSGFWAQGDRWLVEPEEGWTELFVHPGYSFKIVDVLLTNFHLPRSTLLMMVCAFAGKGLIFEAYKEAIKQGYWFFSFGDAMLII